MCDVGTLIQDTGVRVLSFVAKECPIPGGCYSISLERAGVYLGRAEKDNLSVRVEGLLDEASAHER